MSLKPADLFWQAGYGGHDGRLSASHVVRPSVPSADAFESSSVREKLSARDVPNLNKLNPDVRPGVSVVENMKYLETRMRSHFRRDFPSSLNDI